MANLYRADFYGWRTVTGLSKVTIRQKFGNHTLFWLDYAISENQRYLMPPENTPFSTRFGAGPLGTRTVYGYVNHLEEKVDGTGRRFTRLVGLGTSKVMNTTTPSAWEGHTRTGIIRDIGARHRFRTVVYSHPEVLEMWVTGAMSDFRAINTLADEIGYRVWVDGATLWLLDPHLVLASASAASTKVVRLPQQRSAQVFKGSNVPGQVKASKRLVQYGLSRSTNEVLVSTSGEVGQPVEMLTGPVSSYTEAQFAANGAQKAMQDQASVTVSFDGDASLSPGSPVRFDASVPSPDQIGLWLVNEAIHEISSDKFTTTVTATRDQSRQPMSRVPDLVRREGILAKAVVRNGMTWEAETQEMLRV
jgi:hypothetical protein